MIRDVAVRAVVQNNDSVKKKYPLSVIQATTTESYPFQVPTADIEVVSNSRKGTSGYATPIFSDDIIRLQVSTKMRPTKWTLWKDIFVGQIQYPSTSFGSKNTVSLHCTGLMEEVNWTAIKETKEWAVATDAQAIFQYLIDTKHYHRYLSYSPTYCYQGASVPSYNTSLNQTYLSDAITSMEQQSGYTYRASATPIFDNDLNLSSVYLSWKPLSTTPTRKYALIEGTSRYISSDFTDSIEELRNRVTLIGATSGDVSSTQTNPASIAKYGERTRVDTFNWINTTNECASKATGILNYADEDVLYGTATIIGTPEAHPGDLVYCKSQSQEVNGAMVNTYLPVFGVRHNISPEGLFTTGLDVGRANNDAYYYLGMISRNIKTLQRNIVRTGSVTGMNPVGHVTSPTMAGSGADFPNPFSFACRVVVSGGVVTGVAIDGVSTGLTSGMFVLGVGETIRVVYSGVPTWTWWGF